MPALHRVERVNDYRSRLVLVDPDSITEGENDEGETVYEYKFYAVNVPWRADLAADVAENFAAWLEKIKADDYAEAAQRMRAERNALLAKSDKALCLDRMGLTIPNGTTFTAWLTFFKGLGAFLTGSAPAYRQQLRDITQHPNFPYLSPGDWPQPPEGLFDD